MTEDHFGDEVAASYDDGPMSSARIIDLYQPDFFAVCGCASWSGTTTVTVSVY